MNNIETNRAAYERALKRVKRIKGFYRHLMIYLVVNTFLIVLKSRDLGENESILSYEVLHVAIYWGIGLVAHGFSVFLPDLILGKNWEERKIKKLMEQEKKSENRIS